MGFLNPLFFFGALAAAVPILLHLIRREHARKIEFPSLMFLRRISKKTIRYQKLRHLLLLLLRVLAILLVVLAFTRPYRKNAQSAVPAGTPTSAHIIVLDNSMSMNYQDRWDRAKTAAEDIVREAGPGDQFAILEFSDTTSSRTELTSQPSDVLAQIEDGVNLSDRSTRYAQAIKTAERFALEAGTGKRIIHLISDFQKNGWSTEEQTLRLNDGIELQYVDVGSDAFTNLAIRDVRVVEDESGAAANIGIQASIVNYGNSDRKNVPVRLYVDERRMESKSIDIGKGGLGKIEFRLPNLLSGLHPAVIEVDDPYLVRDNRFYLTVATRGKTPVQIAENPGKQSRRSPGYFLAKALDVHALSPYKLVPLSLQNPVISEQLLIWNDVPSGNPELQKMLRDFVKTGGGLIVVLGNETRAADFNRGFGSWLPVKMIDRVVVARNKRARPAENYVLMTDVRMDHPIFQPFRAPHSGTFSNIRFYNYARVTAGSNAEIPARFENGDPALISIDVEKGRVLIFTSSADDSSNDLPLKAVYAPLWHQMLRFLENFRERRHWLEIGDVVDYRKQFMEATSQRERKNIANEAMVVRDPAKRRLAIPPDSDDIFLEQAGFYEIRTVNQNVSIAVNTVPSESDLTHGNAEEMTAGWISSGPATFSQDKTLAAEEQGRNQTFWIFLLMAALLFFVSEALLSNYELRMTNDELKKT